MTADPTPVAGEPRTAAGRALWLSIAENERLSTNGVRMSMYRDAILAIEAEAASPAALDPEHGRFVGELWVNRETKPEQAWVHHKGFWQRLIAVPLPETARLTEQEERT